MEAVAHNPEFAHKAGVPQSVGKDFAAADKSQSFAGGGVVSGNKGYMGKNTEGAKGGASLGRTRDFLKESDGKDQKGFGKIPDDGFKNPDLDEQDYSSKKEASGIGKKRSGDKCLPLIKPRS